MIKIIITSIILFIIFIIILLSLNVKIEYFNSGSNEPIISGDYITDNIDVDNVYYMFRSGTSTFTISSFIICDILVVGGGGGGGSRHGGGGGAGALIYEQNKTLNAGTYIITIGTGGSGGNAGVAATNGRDTSISLNGTGNIYLAKGGGFGGSHFNGNAVSGGSGGGNGAAGSIGNAVTTNIPVGTYGNSGNVGGTGGSYPSWIGYGGGGGGGAETRGGSLTTDNRGYGIAGSGGNGKLITIRGINEYFAGGGGGGISAYAISGGKGGLGGGGDGTKGYIVGNAGQANTGGGGGGSGFNDYTNASAAIAGGAGGSGVVIIRINKKTNSYIDNSSDCPVNLIPSGLINQIPNTNMNINVISRITRKNDFMYNQSFGNGNITYTITFSKYLNDEYIPTNLFLRNNKLTVFAIGNYNNGIFNRNINNGLNNYTEKGDFIHITLPSNITLKRYGFRADGSAVPRAPGSWVLYTGSRLLENTNVNKQLLASNLMKLDNNSYCQKNQFTHIHDIQTNGISGNELLFIFPSLAGSANVLSFMELLLYSS